VYLFIKKRTSLAVFVVQKKTLQLFRLLYINLSQCLRFRFGMAVVK
jgi:hypothetical protein